VRDRPASGVEEVAAVLAAAYPLAEPAFSAESARRCELLNGVRSNAAGILRYLQRHTEAPADR